MKQNDEPGTQKSKQQTREKNRWIQSSIIGNPRTLTGNGASRSQLSSENNGDKNVIDDGVNILSNVNTAPIVKRYGRKAPVISPFSPSCSRVSSQISRMEQMITSTVDEERNKEMNSNEDILSLLECVDKLNNVSQKFDSNNNDYDWDNVKEEMNAQMMKTMENISSTIYSKSNGMLRKEKAIKRSMVDLTEDNCSTVIDVDNDDESAQKKKKMKKKPTSFLLNLNEEFSTSSQEFDDNDAKHDVDKEDDMH